MREICNVWLPKVYQEVAVTRSLRQWLQCLSVMASTYQLQNLMGHSLSSKAIRARRRRTRTKACRSETA